MDQVFKILAVDDDQVDRMTVHRALQKAGVQMDFSEVGDCATTTKVLENQSFDCIFLDYRLPDGDGLELVQTLRNKGVGTPLIVLTGQGDEQIAVELMKAGATDYLSKDRISSDTLARVLRNAVQLHQAQLQTQLANQRLQETNNRLLQQNKELEQQRQRIHHQNLQLLEASRLKSEFLAMMSHELRTPMNAIIGFSQLLLRQRGEQPLSAGQTEMLNRILNNGKNLLALLNEVLDFSKIEAGRLELQCRDVNLPQVLTTTVEELRSLAEEKNLDLQVELDLSDPTVNNDPTRIRQVVINFLSNALKFTESGWVRVKAYEIPEGDRIAIAVQDTGIGISSDDLATIFEPFRQTDQTMTRKHSGTGLGLAIADSLAQMMQGKVQVDSQLGKGSTFRIEFPRHAEAE